jgi:hypothetical protein
VGAHPTFLGLRDDKDARTVVRETFPRTRSSPFQGFITDRTKSAIANARAAFGVQKVKGDALVLYRGVDLDGNGDETEG